MNEKTEDRRYEELKMEDKRFWSCKKERDQLRMIKAESPLKRQKDSLSGLVDLIKI